MGLMSTGSVGCWLGPTTVICADAVPPFPASVEVTALVTLFCAPAVAPTTFTVKVHEVAVASVAPDRLTLAEPLAAVIVPPPHVPVKPLGDDTVSPDGKASVKPIPLSNMLLLGLESVKVKVVLPFNATLAAPNAFPMVGGSFWGGGELLDDPSFEQRGIMQTIQHPKAGPYKMPAWPVRFSGSPPPIRPAPLLGGNNADVLHDWLGMSPDAVGSLQADKVI